MSRILIVDDDPLTCAMEREILEPEGHQVEVAGDGQAGVEKILLEGGFDLILCDLKMPDWSGVDTIGFFQIIEKPVRVLVVSGYLEHGDFAPELARFPSVVGCLAKPFEREPFLAKVREALAAPMPRH